MQLVHLHALAEEPRHCCLQARFTLPVHTKLMTFMRFCYLFPLLETTFWVSVDDILADTVGGSLTSEKACTCKHP